MKEKRIYVTKPSLPDLKEFLPYLEKIWETRILTNNGPFHQQFEKELAEFLGVKYVSLFVNGTLALVTALQALKITGEVITTPYSFVATTHSLWWNNIKPVFVDIEPKYCNIDPDKIKSAITPKTTAILPVHVYGNPANVQKIQKIAKTHNLKVIYDAAHAFGVKIRGDSVLNFGDLSILSFHATKPFNTMEGGAIVCHDEEMKTRIDHLKNFGFAGEISVIEPGINAKMNEFQSALGILQLKHHKEYIAKRKKIAEFYRENLKGINGIALLTQNPDMEDYNYSYFPIFVDEKEYNKTRDNLYLSLKENGIYTRRYFYPLISNFPIYRGLESAKVSNLPIAEKTTEQVLCLPVYPGIENKNLEKIVRIISNSN